jgi:hypothetical protein
MTIHPIHCQAEIEFIHAEKIEGEPDKLPTFKVTAYTGGDMRVSRYADPVAIDLAGMKEAKSIIANLNHDGGQIVGHVTDVKNTGKKVVLSGVVSGTSAAALEVVANARNGFPWQASVEVQPLKVMHIEAEAKTEINGRTLSGPLDVAVESELYAFAFVPRGADQSTAVKIAAQHKGDPAMDQKFKEWIIAQSLDPETLSDKAVA